MNELDVVGFGALNVDQLFRVNRIAAAEEESFVADHVETCGGSAANTVVALARLGMHVGFLGNVGDDAQGRLLLEDFRREHVDTNGIRIVKSGRSGRVMGFVDDEGQRALYIEPGVNDQIERVDIDPDYVLKAKFLHLTSFVGKKSFESQKMLVKAVSRKVKVSLDPGALYARLGLAELKPIVDHTFVIMPNAVELKLLTREKNYRRGARVLVDRGTEIVAVKLGRRGCYVVNREESLLLEPFKVKVVDTTGAGDAFDAGFLFGLLRGKGLRECARIGNFVASRSIMAMGARSSLPAFEGLETLGLV